MVTVYPSQAPGKEPPLFPEFPVPCAHGDLQQWNQHHPWPKPGPGFWKMLLVIRMNLNFSNLASLFIFSYMAVVSFAVPSVLSLCHLCSFSIAHGIFCISSYLCKCRILLGVYWYRASTAKAFLSCRLWRKLPSKTDLNGVYKAFFFSNHISSRSLLCWMSKAGRDVERPRQWAWIQLAAMKAGWAFFSRTQYSFSHRLKRFLAPAWPLIKTFCRIGPVGHPCLGYYSGLLFWIIILNYYY